MEMAETVFMWALASAMVAVAAVVVVMAGGFIWLAIQEFRNDEF